MQKITPFLWFDGKAEEAMLFYTSVFKHSAKGEIRRFPDGRVITASWTLEGQDFVGLNGGPMYKFTPATSWFVNCEDQAEVDDLWQKLLADGGKPSRCGWLTDKYGVSWQIIPKALGQLLQDKDAARAGRVMQAMMAMVKIDVAGLEKAAAGP